MAYKPKVITVPEGGSNLSSLTAYAVLCGGTSTTGTLQQVSGVGSSTQVLTSNGASALPTWQAAPSGGTSSILYFIINGSSAPADATTYYITASDNITTSTTVANSKFIIPVTCTLSAVYGVVTCTTGTSENVTMAIRKNNSTDTTITSTLKLNVSPATFSATGLSTAFAAGDYFSLKMVTPTWVTNPSIVNIEATIYFTV